MFSLICVWINGWVNNREAGDLRRYRGHYDVIVMNGEWPSAEKSSGCRKEYLGPVFKAVSSHTNFDYEQTNDYKW